MPEKRGKLFGNFTLCHAPSCLQKLPLLFGVWNDSADDKQRSKPHSYSELLNTVQTVAKSIESHFSVRFITAALEQDSHPQTTVVRWRSAGYNDEDLDAAFYLNHCFLIFSWSFSCNKLNHHDRRSEDVHYFPSWMFNWTWHIRWNFS